MISRFPPLRRVASASVATGTAATAATTTAAVAVLALVAPVGLAAQSSPCGELPSSARDLPASVPDTPPDPQPYDRLRVGDVPLGVGHLRPVDEGYVWDWHTRMRLPLFEAPTSGAPRLWIADGWLVSDGGQARPFGTAGLIETDYETPSLIVAERRGDGWLRVRYAADGAAGWTHECFFEDGPHPLVFEPWEDRLMSEYISPLYFLRSVPHALRAEPSLDAERVLTIPAAEGEYHIEPLEVSGDWMRVRVAIPSTYCRDPDAPAPLVREGWVQWRDAERGPWVWYYTRGC